MFDFFKGLLARIRNCGAIFRWENESQFVQHYLANGSIFHVTNVPSAVVASNVEPHRNLNQETDGKRDVSTQTPNIQTNISLPVFQKEWRRMYRQGEPVRLPVYRVIDQGHYVNTTQNPFPASRIWLNLDRNQHAEVAEG